MTTSVLPAAGDLLLYRSSGSLSGRIIAWRSGSPTAYVHCDIALGDGTSIEALSTGVARVPGHNLTLRDVYPTGAHCTRLADGVDWLKSQVGRHYGWCDIVNAAISLVLPNGPFLMQPNTFDCSDLCVRFLIAAGYPVAESLAAVPAAIKPNDLPAIIALKGS